MKRWLGFGAAFALVAPIGLRLYQQLPDTEAAPSMSPGAMARPVRAAAVTIGAVSESVVLVGSLRAEERVEVTAKVNGRLVAVPVDLGDELRVGARPQRRARGSEDAEAHDWGGEPEHAG